MKLRLEEWRNGELKQQSDADVPPEVADILVQIQVDEASGTTKVVTSYGRADQGT